MSRRKTTSMLERQVGRFISTKNPKEGYFFTLDELFEKVKVAGIPLDKNNKKHYQMVMSVLQDWRKEHATFIKKEVEKGEFNLGYYKNYDKFIRDYNELAKLGKGGGFFIWHTKKKTKDGKKISGYYQPQSFDRLLIEQDRKNLGIKIVRNRSKEEEKLGMKTLLHEYIDEDTKKIYEEIDEYWEEVEKEEKEEKEMETEGE